MVGAVVLVVAACSGSGSKPTAKVAPKPTAPLQTSTTAVNLLTVPGNPRTSTSLSTDINGGGATIVGTVSGPDGPVGDATVHIERLIGEQATSVDVRAANGSWQLGAVQGGRYRVRAWRAPDLAQLDPEVFFVGGTETKQVTLRMSRFGELSVIGASDPAPLVVGEQGNLLTQVVAGSVDNAGFVSARPRPGLAVQLVASTGMTLDGPDKQVTDGEGRNGWRITCTAAVPPTPVLVIGAARFAVVVAACAPPSG